MRAVRPSSRRLCHLCSAICSGFVASLCSTPADVAKSRIMAQAPLPDGSLPYNGTLDCWRKVVANEGPMALWTADKPTGPYKFKAYVLDGAADLSDGQEAWDSGRYSESRVMYHNGLFHLFASGSPEGTSVNPNPDKVHEQIGWAVSKDGIHFTAMKWNPVVRFNESQPHTVALAESHVWFDDEQELVILFQFCILFIQKFANPTEVYRFCTWFICSFADFRSFNYFVFVPCSLTLPVRPGHVT